MKKLIKIVTKSRKIARKLITKVLRRDQYGTASLAQANRYLARDGITKPTKCIRTRFYRKK